MKLAQRKGLQFYQTRSNAITLFNTLPAICIEEVVYMKIEEELYCKVYQSKRAPRVVLTPNFRPIPMRENPPTVKANEALTRKPVAHFSRTHVASIPEKVRRWRYRETCRGNVEHRLPGIPHSTVQKEDTNRKETVKRLIQQSENHLNRDSLMQDMNKTEEFNPSSEKSKELITDLGNTEIFELCETSSKLQCPDCTVYWEVGIIYCTCG